MPGSSTTKTAIATRMNLGAHESHAVVVIDCDLQDPPELIDDLVVRWREGYDVVYAQHRTRAGETLPKRIVLIGLNGLIGFSRYPLQLISMMGSHGWEEESSP